MRSVFAGCWFVCSTLLVSIATAEEPELDKSEQPFLLSKPIHGYKYGQVIELIKREDGLYVKADSEYQKARNQVGEIMVTKFRDTFLFRRKRSIMPRSFLSGFSINNRAVCFL